MTKLRLGLGVRAQWLFIAVLSLGCGSATIHTDGGAGGTSQAGAGGGAGAKGTAGQGGAAAGAGGGSAGTTAAAGTTGAAGAGGAAGGKAGGGGSASAGAGGGAAGSAGHGAAGATGTAGAGGAGGAVACATPCAATAYCASGTCKSRFTEYTIGTGSDPSYITSGADGNLWFTTGNVNGAVVGGKLGRVTPTGTPTLFPILTTNPNNLSVISVGIISGPDDNIWFGAVGSDGKGYISTATASGSVTNYQFSMSDPRLGRMAVGPDGNIWMAVMDLNPEAGSNKIEVCSTSGSISEKTLPSYSCPYGIVTGPDGNMWFTETASPYEIARLTLTGTLTEFSTSTWGQNITVGADSNLWFTEPYSGTSSIGRYTTGGTLVEFPAPTASSSPWDLTKGPDGNVWFTELGANNIGSITPGGKITEYATPATPYGITAGPDGNIWFTEPSAGKVVRFLVP
jgi:virginiamycin B lyase